jgi:macrolide-specific efflux system membrane fusion protein
MPIARTTLVNGGLAIVVVAAAVGGVLLLVNPFSASGSESATRLTGTVQQGTVSSTISASGAIAPVREESATFSVAGTVNAVAVGLGTAVTQGQVLATLDPGDLTTAANQAYSAYVHSRENLAAAQAATPAQVAQVNAAEDARDKAWTSYESAKQDLAAATLVAPISGLVIAVNGEVGDDAGGSGGGTAASADSTSTAAGTGFMVIADTSSYIVSADIAEADIADVTVGQAATVSFPAMTGVTAAATVTAIAPTATTSNSIVTYATTITLSEVPDGLRLGQTAAVAITVASSATDALYVPAAAITTASDGTSTVSVLDAKTGKASDVAVETGVVGDEGTEIRSGLKSGETIVLGTVAASTGTGASTGGGAGAGQQGGSFPGGGGVPGGRFGGGGQQ